MHYSRPQKCCNCLIKQCDLELPACLGADSVKLIQAHGWTSGRQLEVRVPAARLTEQRGFSLLLSHHYATTAVADHTAVTLTPGMPSHVMLRNTACCSLQILSHPDWNEHTAPPAQAGTGAPEWEIPGCAAAGSGPAARAWGPQDHRAPGEPAHCP